MATIFYIFGHVIVTILRAGYFSGPSVLVQSWASVADKTKFNNYYLCI